MARRRLTCRRGFDRYKTDGLVCAIHLDQIYEDEVAHTIITENDEKWLEDSGRILIRKCNDRHYLVGEVANRLYEYEQLGYSPEELKEIIELYKGRKERLNALYGTNFAATQSDYWKSSGITGIIEAFSNSDYAKYVKHDVESTKALTNIPEIKDVIFNDPATIVLWADGTKTVVKADKEAFDPE